MQSYIDDMEINRKNEEQNKMTLESMNEKNTNELKQIKMSEEKVHKQGQYGFQGNNLIDYEKENKGYGNESLDFKVVMSQNCEELPEETNKISMNCPIADVEKETKTLHGDLKIKLCNKRQEMSAVISVNLSEINMSCEPNKKDTDATLLNRGRRYVSAIYVDIKEKHNKSTKDSNTNEIEQDSKFRQDWQEQIGSNEAFKFKNNPLGNKQCGNKDRNSCHKTIYQNAKVSKRNNLHRGTLGMNCKWKEKCMNKNWRDKTNENCQMCSTKLWSNMCKSNGQCLKCCLTLD